MISSNVHRVVKEFLIKSLEFILSTRCPSPSSTLSSSQNRNPCLQLVLNETHSVRTAFPVIWNHDLQSPLKIYLELAKKTDSGGRVLVERWEFVFSPAEVTTCDHPETFLKKSSISLRSLFLSALQSPSYSSMRGQLAYSLVFSPESLTPWPAGSTAMDLDSFPKHMFRVESDIGSVSSRVTYLRTVPKEDFGVLLGLQRMVSLDVEDEKRDSDECSGGLGSWSSAEEKDESWEGVQALVEVHYPLRRGGDGGDGGGVAISCLLRHPLSDVLPLPKDLSIGSESSGSEEEMLGQRSPRRKDSNPFDPQMKTDSEHTAIADFSKLCRQTAKDIRFGDERSSILEGISTLKRTLGELRSQKEELRQKSIDFQG